MWLDLGLISKSLGWAEGYSVGILSRGNIEMVGRGGRSVLGMMECNAFYEGRWYGMVRCDVVWWNVPASGRLIRCVPDEDSVC